MNTTAQIGQAIKTLTNTYTTTKAVWCPLTKSFSYEAIDMRGVVVTLKPWARRPDLFTIYDNGCVSRLVIRQEGAVMVDATHRFRKGEVIPYEIGGMTFYRREMDTFDGCSL